MNQTVKNTLNPKHPTGGYALPYAPVLTVLGLILAFLAGAFTGERVTANFYRTHFAAPLPVPKGRTRITVKVGTLPAAAGIYFRFLNTQNDDQGPLGSCQAWAAAKELSYGFNEIYPYHYRLYSPRYLYDAVSSGQDNGSYLEQYPPVVLAHGIAPWSVFPYGASALALGYPGYAVENSVPSSIQSIAAAHHLSISEQYLYGNPGAGMGGVALIKQQLAAHQPVNLDLQVFPEYDRANADGSTVVPPSPGEVSRGGHANVAVSFDDNHRNPDGTSGAILASNQWSKEAGVGRDGVRHTTATNGFVWLSYGFVAQDTWGAAVLHVAQGLPGVGKMLSADGGTSQQHLPPYTFQKKATTHIARGSHVTPPTSPADARKVGTSWYVQNVRASNGTDLSALINQWGDYYHVWPLGIAATVGTESGYNIYAERWAGGLDNSCGLLQQIVVNVYPIIGNYNARVACNWEEVPSNSIYLGTRLYAEYFAYQHGCVQWTQAYGMYNAGPGWPCSFYYNLTGVAYSNYVNNFLPNYYWALSHFQSFNPPPPPPRPKPKPHYRFPGGTWEHYRLHHHLSRIPHTWHRKLSLVATVWWTVQGRKGRELCGGIVSREHWNERAHVMSTQFQGCKIWTFPTHRGWNPVIKRHRWIR